MPINLPRRQKVMARSQKLGHCVCNVKKNCPCDILIEQNVCPCAGERPATPPDTAPINLMATVEKAGCASKIGQGDLKRILSALPEISNPNILVGMAAGDDAGVWRLDERTALVQTVDVFTPCVGDPYLFGQIAAANSVSDVYAMGGRPLTALSIVCFPIDTMDGGVMREMLRGGIDKLNEAGCALIGGHSVSDAEVKLGFAVTGLIDPARVVQRAAARPGDLLVLTKPLGTGMVAFAAQLAGTARVLTGLDRIVESSLAEAAASMAALNKDAAELMLEYGAHAATDVTGFGLAGHLVELARGSGVSAELDLRRLPVFAAVEACLQNEILPGAIERNQEYAMAWVRNEDPENEHNLPILYDPQTSGGMLVALPEENAQSYIDALRERAGGGTGGSPTASIIGRIIEKTPNCESAVIIKNARLENFIGPISPISPISPIGPIGPIRPIISVDPPTPQKEQEKMESSCCSGGAASAPESHETGPDAMAMFKEFMKAANEPGLIDRRNKKLMAIMLSIAVRCTPCLKIHLKSALAMGLSKAEIDEAASLAIAFGGCSAMMFYKEIWDALES